MIFRLSQKLNKKIKTGKLSKMPVHENPFADWSCHLFTANRTQYIILCNTKSLYSCAMIGKGITNKNHFVERALNCIQEFMADDARQLAYRKFVAPQSGTIQFSKALNHSVTSSINQLVEFAEILLIEAQLSPYEVGFRLNDFLLSALATEKSQGYGTPNEAFKLLYDGLENDGNHFRSV